MRVRQRGVTRVRARLVVLRLPGNRPAARVSLGWLKTGQATTVPLPSTLRLRTGRYLVRLHVTDPRGHTLARSATYPGRARIIVRHRKPPPAGAPAPAPAPAVAPEAAVVPAPALLVPVPAPSPGGPAVFPIAGAFNFGGADARFGAGRKAMSTRGRTSSPPPGRPVVAPYAGLISRTSYQAKGAGEYVVLDAIDGRDYFFAHCVRGSTVVAPSAAVAAGQAALPGRRDRCDGRRLAPAFRDLAGRLADPRRRADRSAARAADLGRADRASLARRGVVSLRNARTARERHR